MTDTQIKENGGYTSIEVANIVSHDDDKIISIKDMMQELQEDPIFYPPHDEDSDKEPKGTEGDKGLGIGYDWSKYSKEAQNMSEVQANILVGLYNGAQATVCQIIAKEPKANFSFDETTKAGITPLVRYEIIHNGGVIPNWLLLMIALSAATGTNLINAYNLRKKQEKTHNEIDNAPAKNG